MTYSRRTQYLGPSALQLSHLLLLVVTNSLVLFALTLLLGRSIWGLSLNVTTIEGWEIERHHALLRRAKVLGGQLDGPDGTKIRLEHQEFPWDVGIFSNFRQAMGTWNIVAWFWPFARSPPVSSGLAYEHNEIDGTQTRSEPLARKPTLTQPFLPDPSKSWPPPDPDRVYRAPREPLSGDGFTQSMDIDDFRKRQQADLQRQQNSSYAIRRRPFHERYGHLTQQKDEDDYYNDEDAIETESEADEEIQSAEASNYQEPADEGEEA